LGRRRFGQEPIGKDLKRIVLTQVCFVGNILDIVVTNKYSGDRVAAGTKQQHSNASLVGVESADIRHTKPEMRVR
jgi:hypothetical protein